MFQVQTWIDEAIYDVRGDVDLDGHVDVTDKSDVQSNQGLSLGKGTLSSASSYKGVIGASHGSTGSLVHARNRSLELLLGRWSRRDPMGYIDGMSLYLYGRGNVGRFVDPSGLQTVVEGCWMWKGWIDCLEGCLDKCVAKLSLPFLDPEWHSLSQELKGILDAVNEPPPPRGEGAIVDINPGKVPGEGPLGPLTGWIDCANPSAKTPITITLETGTGSSRMESETYVHELYHAAEHCMKGDGQPSLHETETYEFAAKIESFCKCGDECQEKYDEYMAYCPNGRIIQMGPHVGYPSGGH